MAVGRRVGLSFLVGRARSQLRRRPGIYGAMTLLLAVVVGAVVLTIDGVARTRTALDRSRATTRALDAVVLYTGPSFDPVETTLSLPEVEDGSRLANFLFVADDGSVMPMAASVDGRIGTALQRDPVIEGRSPDPTAADEVTLPAALANQLGLAVGDTWTLTALGLDQMACLGEEAPPEDPRCSFLATTPLDPAQLTGGPVTLRLVGLTRGPIDADESTASSTIVFLSPAFYSTYGSRFPWSPMTVVRYAPGVTDKQFEDSLDAAVPPNSIADFGTLSPKIDAVRSATDVLANALGVFALVIAASGVVSFAVICARLTAADSHERAVLRSFGATRPLLALDAFVPLLAVIVAGSAVGVVVSWLASGRMPVGLARRLEPSLGLHLDLARTAAVAGSCLLGAMLVAGAVATWATRPSRRGRRHALPVTTIVPLTSAVATSTGIRAALERGSNERAAPTRTSTIGAAVSVTVIVAVATFGGALGRLVEHPSRYGYGWDVTVSGIDVETVAADPDVAAAAPIWTTLRIRLNGRSVIGWAYDPGRGDPGFVQLEGRLPEANDEVSLGAETMRAAGIELGDTVDVDGRAFRVVGQALFPTTSNAFPLADGALVSNGAMQEIDVQLAAEDPWTDFVAARLRPGADQAAVVARLGPLGDNRPPELVIVPLEVNQLRQLRTFPVTLGALLIAIALLGVGVGLAQTLHRRAGDRAVWAALGFTKRQLRWSVAAQATTLACIAVAVGVPAGLVLGNRIWAVVARSYGLGDDAFVPWWIAAVVPVAIVLTNLLALLVSRRRTDLGSTAVLHVE